MSNLDLMVHQIPLPIYPNYHILSRNVSNFGTRLTIMIPIDEDEETEIDNIGDNTITFNRGESNFSIAMKDIYCYGEVNFDDKDTLDKINIFKFLDYLGASGVPIYARYDYKTHSCTSPKRFCLWSETWKPAELAKMAHGYLGKPQRILLFNKTVKR